MGLRRIFLLLFLVAALFPGGRVWGRSGEAYIDSVTLKRGPGGDVLLSFRIQRAFDQRILDTLDSGIPVRFTYWIQVVRPRGVLPDRVVTEVRLDRSMVKDNLKDRYRITVNTGEPRDLPSLTEAIEAMTQVDRVSLVPLEALSRKAPLLLKIKAKLQKFKLPFHLHYLFAFVSYWDVDTDWYVLELPRNAEALP
jgi:hypothetical protein